MPLATQSAQPFATTSPAPPVRLRILWADDDEIVRRIGSAVLTGAGHEIVTVNDGWEAAEKIAAEPRGWDVLITDHDMPWIDGLTLVSQLRHVNFSGRIIVISGSVDEFLATSYRRHGVAAILAKPFNPQELLSIIGLGQKVQNGQNA